MSASERRGRYVRVVTYGREIPDIEADLIRAVGGGARVLVSAGGGMNGIDAREDSRNATVAAWAEGVCREHGLDWRRVGRDVLFGAVQE